MSTQERLDRLDACQARVTDLRIQAHKDLGKRLDAIPTADGMLDDVDVLEMLVQAAEDKIISATDVPRIFETMMEGAENA